MRIRNSGKTTGGQMEVTNWRICMVAEPPLESIDTGGRVGLSIQYFKTGFWERLWLWNGWLWFCLEQAFLTVMDCSSPPICICDAVSMFCEQVDAHIHAKTIRLEGCVRIAVPFPLVVQASCVDSAPLRSLYSVHCDGHPHINHEARKGISPHLKCLPGVLFD